MERYDFSSVMAIVRRFISNDYNTNQTELLGVVFSSIFNQPDAPGAFDMAFICHWFIGQVQISPKISQYYAKFGNRKNWQKIWKTVFFPSRMTAQWLHRSVSPADAG